MSATTKIRMNWLDAARLSAAFCIIGIHTTTDSNGKAFADYEVHERIFPALMRTVAELASTEFFILVSLFLLAFKLERKPMAYADTMMLQARRLLVPFAFWTVFYAFFVLIKAHSFGYLDPMLERLASPQTWVGYFLLGNAQYHMHFLPTIFMIFLFHPVFKLALKQPVLGFLIVPFLGLYLLISGWIWANVTDKTTIDYLARFIKILSYLGYGFAAYSLLGLWQRKIDAEFSRKILFFGLLVVFILFLIKLTHAADSIKTGVYVTRLEAVYFAHTLLPVAVILVFFGSQHFQWPDRISNWSKFTFGTYLMHPAVIDVIDLLLKNHQMAPYQYVIFKYTVTLSSVLMLSIIISKIRFLAWTIGLGPLPFTKQAKLAANKQKTRSESASSTQATNEKSISVT